MIVERESPCSPTGDQKAGTGPYRHSLSNLDDNKLRGTGWAEIEETSLRIFPNPFTEMTTIQFPNTDHAAYMMILRDLSGKAVMIMNDITEDRVVIKRGNLKAGFYSVELRGDNLYRGRFVIE